MTRCFEGFDLENFWRESEYANEKCVDEKPDEKLIDEIENELGYKLPDSYIELMKVQNGGYPHNACFPTNESTSWASDHVAITGFKSIGRKKLYSLCGDLGSEFMISEWEYPKIGVYFGDCPSAGHDMICLDYRECGVDGEPKVVHVDQESDYKITFLANSFEEFVRGLRPDSDFEESEEW